MSQVTAQLDGWADHTRIRLGDLIRAERVRRRSRWRRLEPGRQALPVLAHLRNGDTHARRAPAR